MHPANRLVLPLWAGFLLAVSASLSAAAAAPREVRTAAETLGIIRKVNDRWQREHPGHGDAFWNRAVYHVGNMHAYQVTRDESYRRFSDSWARHNQWQGAKSDKRAEWRYDYGESERFVLFGDWQVCFQVYMMLYHLNPKPAKIARAREVMEYQLNTPQNDYLWWSDGLFMVMPTMTELHRITGNPKYLAKLRDYFDYATGLMYDPQEGLFFRDAKYVYPKHKSVNGKKDFWSRGNGWVLAALPLVIDGMPKNHPDREHYLGIFKEMARALAASRQKEGHWTRSILDPEHAPGPETSGTSFFAFGFLWGLRTGVLDAGTYGPVARDAWDFLVNTSLQDDGTVGYIQPIGEKAIPGQIVNARSTADFGVGAFLMAASEMVRYLESR
jgi:unsaturated rhamnogalacturonyl hydrolase